MTRIRVAGRGPAGRARTSEIRISSSSDEQRLLEIRISLVLTPRAARRHEPASLGGQAPRVPCTLFSVEIRCLRCSVSRSDASVASVDSSTAAARYTLPDAPFRNEQYADPGAARRPRTRLAGRRVLDARLAEDARLRG